MNPFQAVKHIAGYQRDVQDRAEIIERQDGLVLVVADGAGGMGGGAEAAEFVIETVKKWARVDSLPDEEDWCRCLTEIDFALAADSASGETTAVVLSVTPKRIMGASIGDSGAWVLHPAEHNALTQFQFRKPLLGSGGAIPVPFTADAFDGTLLLASDGLLKYAPAEPIYRIAQELNLETAAASLIECVRLPSGALWDDVAVILCRRNEP